MQIQLSKNSEEGSDRVASLILALLRKKPAAVLGLATGSTPIAVYRHLIDACRRGDADFSQVHTFNLDEYLDLPPDHPQSYRHFMNEHLFHGTNIPRENVHFPPSEGDNLLQRCTEYEDLIRAVGGIDIQLLGIGSNGHIGFNEPTSSLFSRTRIKTLTEKTLADNSRFYDGEEEQPRIAVTMGIGTILDARTILLQAFGERKAEAIHATVEGPVSGLCP